jgi:aldehyde dehydrogenase (NAD+)
MHIFKTYRPAIIGAQRIDKLAHRGPLKPERAAKLVPYLGATSVMINDCIIPAAHPEASIGGRGESGLGLSRGEAGLLEMTRAVYVSRSPGLMGRSLSKPPGFVVGLFAKVLRWTYGR